jgi:hypothetical protein
MKIAKLIEKTFQKLAFRNRLSNLKSVCWSRVLSDCIGYQQLAKQHFVS